jgi:hypothetical protein
MYQEYNEMMKWALGDDYGGQNVKQAPLAWQKQHPDFPPLMLLEGKPAGANAYFFIYQMTIAWIAHDYQCVLNCPSNEETPKEESQNVKETLRDILRVVWSDFLSCFKRKTRT